MTVSAALLVAVFGISGSVTGSVDKLVAGLGGRAVLEVSGITDAGFGQDLLGPIAAAPGVRTAVPMLRAQTGADADRGPADRALLIGADARIAELGSSLTGSLGSDAAKLLNVPNGVLTGAAMGYQEGDTFPLGTGTATVAGILDAHSHAVGTGPASQRPARNPVVRPYS